MCKIVSVKKKGESSSLYFLQGGLLVKDLSCARLYCAQTLRLKERFARIGSFPPQT